MAFARIHCSIQIHDITLKQFLERKEIKIRTTIEQLKVMCKLISLCKSGRGESVTIIVTERFDIIVLTFRNNKF